MGILPNAVLIASLVNMVIANLDIHLAASKSSEKLVFAEKQNTGKYVFKHTGDSVNLSCIADGNPPPHEITWKKFLPGSKNKYSRKVENWIHIEHLTQRDTGRYDCSPCNIDSCLFYSYYLVVDNLIHKESTKNQTTLLYSQYELKCNVIFGLQNVISDQIRVKWFKFKMQNKDNPQIPANVPELQTRFLNNVTKKDRGWYTCQVESCLGYNYASIYLIAFDEFGPFMVDKTSKEEFVFRRIGDSITFECNAYGIPMPGIYWGKDYRNFKRDNERIEYVNRSIVIRNLTASDKGRYHCQNCNGYDCAGYVFYFDVVTLPNVTTQIHSTAVLECGVTEYYLIGSVVQWTKHYVDPDHLELPPNVSNLKSRVTSNNTLMIEDISHEDEGWYTCMMFNGYDDSYSSVYLKAVDHQVLNPQSPNKEVLINTGETVELVCGSKRSHPHDIIWTKQKQEIKRKDITILIEHAVFSDGGDYECQVCTDIGCSNHSYRLIVDTIFAVDSMQNISVNERSGALLTCETIFDTGEPTVHDIFWYKFQECEETNITLNRDSFPNMKSGNKSNQLRFTNVTKADEGWYSCEVMGHCKSAYLHVLDPQDPYGIMPSVLLGSSAFIMLIVILLVGRIRVLREKQNATNIYWKRQVTILKENLDTICVRIEPIKKPVSQNKDDSVKAVAYKYEFPLDPKWEFPRDKLHLGQQLGEGAFGRVVLAEAQSIATESSIVTSKVAVKMLKEGHTEADVRDLVYELEVLKLIGHHPNIINLLGCCSQDGPLFVIVEYAPNGDLLSYLRSFQLNSSDDESDYLSRTFSSDRLISFALQIARGIEYLASKKCIHRDLAARNVLVGEDNVMKICDFGLARDIYTSNYYEKKTTGKLPFRWMAPESLERDFYSIESDVWSFGVLLWEIMTVGEHPYSTFFDWDGLLGHFRGGKRLELPASCPDNVCKLINDCWRFEPKKRPTFREVVQRLEQSAYLVADRLFSGSSIDKGESEEEIYSSDNEDSETDKV